MSVSPADVTAPGIRAIWVGRGVGQVTARPTAFGVYIAFGLTFIVGYFLLPQAAQNLAFIASNLCAAGVIFVCAGRRDLTPRSGWLLLA